MKFVFKLFIAILFSVPSMLAAANDVMNTSVQNSATLNSVTASSVTSLAKEWDLTETEWKRYASLIQGQSGHYYQKLSPPEVLGINAETSEEMNHFAEISAKQEHDKLEKELKFNLAFHEAASKLYANEQLIKPFNLAPYTLIPKNAE